MTVSLVNDSVVRDVKQKADPTQSHALALSGGERRIGVLKWEFCKSQTTKKGPPFGEPF
jgi:hypothetical protein